jgi:hypothetical protein
MSLPFTTEQFLEIFRQYNTSIWPMQFVMVAMALIAVGASARGTQHGRVVAGYLAGQWVWTGVVYHWVFFTRVNPAARLFGALWMAGGLLFAWNAIGRRPLSFHATQPARLAVGATLILYALVVYPILGHFGGRPYPFAPTYGAPCPVTILTVGLLCLARPPIPRHLFVGPVIWAAVGSSAAFALGVHEDLGLLVAGLIALVLVVLPGRSPRVEPQPV